MHTPLASASRTAPFKSSRRRRRRGMSDLRWRRALSSSGMSFRCRMRSMTAVMRPSKIDTKPATAPNESWSRCLRYDLRKLAGIGRAERTKQIIHAETPPVPITRPATAALSRPSAHLCRIRSHPLSRARAGFSAARGKDPSVRSGAVPVPPRCFALPPRMSSRQRRTP